MTNRRRLLAGALALAACRRKRRSPEERVRFLIADLESAVEDKDLAPIKAVVSERYKDKHDGDRRAVIGTLQVMFLRHPAIHLLVRINGVELIAPGRVRAEVLVAMAAVPVRKADELPRVNAELYEFVVVFAEEEPEVFRVVEATWSPARLEGFL